MSPPLPLFYAYLPSPTNGDSPEIMAPNSVEQSKGKIADGEILGTEGDGSTRIIITRIMEGQAMWTLRQISGWLKMLYVRVVEVTSGAVPGHAVSSNPQRCVLEGEYHKQIRFASTIQKATVI